MRLTYHIPNNYESNVKSHAGFRLTINRRNSCLLGIGSPNLSFLPGLAPFVYEIVQKLYKIVDSISCFPHNSMKYALRIT
jgi:hypothetical protein